MTRGWHALLAGSALAILLAFLGLFTRVIAPGPSPAPEPLAVGSPVAQPRERLCRGRTPLPPRDIIRVGGAVTPPERLVYVRPVYPAAAKATNTAGVVILEAVLDAEGVVRTTRVLRSIPLLDDAAADAVCEWKFAPARVEGKPMPVALTVTVPF